MSKKNETKLVIAHQRAVREIGQMGPCEAYMTITHRLLKFGVYECRDLLQQGLVSKIVAPSA